ncbi:hypothetical protein ANN_10813 [Periplaneta americana]|uniref:Uncharacterized protein n=1 Tax=Periplaneta americana TaxID=6978 RepID=A0ABQ8T3A5_PERAM|nr:hypothetical protein ANN_10813 [Periplaneta americana]
MPKLKDEEEQSFIFQQDGAPPHWILRSGGTLVNREGVLTQQSGKSHKTCLRGFDKNRITAWTSAVLHVELTSSASKRKGRNSTSWRCRVGDIRTATITTSSEKEGVEVLKENDHSHAPRRSSCQSAEFKHQIKENARTSVESTASLVHTLVQESSSQCTMVQAQFARCSNTIEEGIVNYGQKVGFCDGMRWLGSTHCTLLPPQPASRRSELVCGPVDDGCFSARNIKCDKCKAPQKKSLKKAVRRARRVDLNPEPTSIEDIENLPERCKVTEEESVGCFT